MFLLPLPEIIKRILMKAPAAFSLSTEVQRSYKKLIPEIFQGEGGV